MNRRHSFAAWSGADLLEAIREVFLYLSAAAKNFHALVLIFV